MPARPDFGYRGRAGRARGGIAPCYGRIGTIATTPVAITAELSVPPLQPSNQLLQLRFVLLEQYEQHEDTHAEADAESP